MFAKGSTVRTTLDFLTAEGGSELVARVLGPLPADVREQLTRVDATGEVPGGGDDLVGLRDQVHGHEPTRGARRAKAVCRVGFRWDEPARRRCPDPRRLS